jgi:tryptophan synthase beta chain
VGVGDEDVLVALQTLSELEGIIPALESAHAVAWIMQEAGKDIPHGSSVLLNMSGRGDKDVAQVRDILRGRE